MTTLPPGSVIGSAPTLWLHEGWRLARTAPGALKDPSQLAGSGVERDGGLDVRLVTVVGHLEVRGEGAAHRRAVFLRDLERENVGAAGGGRRGALDERERENALHAVVLQVGRVRVDTRIVRAVDGA